MGLAGFHRMTYTHDTLIGGFEAQVLDMYSAIQYPQPPPGPTFSGPPYTSYTSVARITRSDGDVVFTLDGSVWDTLYWFGADPGDHWFPSHVDEPSCEPITVVDTGTTVIGGVPLRWLLTTDGITVMERVGSTWDMLMYCPNWIVDGPMGLRCYSDDEVSYHPATGECEMLMGTNGITAAPYPAIHPNPGTDHFTLSLLPGLHTLTLFDATGRMVHQQHTQDTPATIDTAPLPSGIYLVKVDEGIQPLRWVKQ